METEGLELSGSAILDGYVVTQPTPTTVQLLMIGGETFPDGLFDEVMQFCIEGLTSVSPEEQEVSITWITGSGDAQEEVASETCTTSCPLPKDQCAELVDPLIYCDDNGVYHYQFSVRNINDRELDASIVVLGPEGTTVPDDISQLTFPDFPEHLPNSDPYLEYNNTTEVIDITLPNATIGSTYEFIISLHDYRNINEELDEYWCCYTCETFTIDVDTECTGSLVSDDPLEHIIYPNPSDNNFRMQFYSALVGDVDILVKNMKGETFNVPSQVSGNDIYNMNIESLIPGLYFVILKDDYGNISQSKFIKK